MASQANRRTGVACTGSSCGTIGSGRRLNLTVMLPAWRPAGSSAMAAADVGAACSPVSGPVKSSGTRDFLSRPGPGRRGGLDPARLVPLQLVPEIPLPEPLQHVGALAPLEVRV